MVYSPEQVACAKLYLAGTVWKRVVDELGGMNRTFDDMNSSTVMDGSDSDIRKNFIGSIPIGLVIAGHRQYSPTVFPKAVTQAFLDMHKELYSNSQYRKLFTAPSSDHWVHMQQPEVVVQAVEYVLQRVMEKQ